MPTRRQAWLRLALIGAAPLAGVGAPLLIRHAGASNPAAMPPDDVCLYAPTVAWDGLGDPLAPRAIPDDARCPVCGMFPARQPSWAAQVLYTDGHAHHLDSPLSLFLYLQQVPRYATGRQRSDIAALHVREHETGRWLAAEQALYVHGSALAGPMRSGNLPATATGEAAQRFISRHGGEAMAFATLVHELPSALQLLAPHRH